MLLSDDSITVNELQNRVELDFGVEVEDLGIRYDYQNGFRITVPDDTWTISLYNRLLGDTTVVNGSTLVNARWYIPWDFEVFHDNASVYKHKYDLKDKTVLLYGGMAIGDSIAWMPYVVEFYKRHNQMKELLVQTNQPMIPLFKQYCKGLRITFISNLSEVKDKKIYASYLIGLHFSKKYHQFLTPIPVVHQPLESVVSWQLGLTPEDATPLRFQVETKRLSEKPYVCIAGLSSGKFKDWNNPIGWPTVINYLQELGYEVFDIDKGATIDVGGTIVSVAPKPTDKTIGDFPLEERAQNLAGADFFIGVSSGLCWLARAVGCPTVMIGGFSLPTNEYRNPYRVFNPLVCCGCLQDGSIELNRFNYFWCPKHSGDFEREFECSTKISPQSVILKIQELMKDYQLDPKNNKLRTQQCNLLTHRPD